MTKYTPSRNYLTAGLAACALAFVSGWFAMRWTPSVVPTILFVLTAGCLVFLAARPVVEIHAQHLKIGNRVIPWADIRSIDRTGWISPLVVLMTLAGKRRVLLVYPGDLETSKSLLRQLRRGAFEATIDGIPYREFWGETLEEPAKPAAAGRKPLASPRYPMLRAEDEAEVERMYQRLKTVGRLDPKGSDEN